MLRDPRLYLAELLSASDYLLEMARVSSLEQYQADQTRRLAVERTFITIGEALTHLSRLYPELLSRLTHPGQIIGFRNLLVHRYWSTDDETVWSIIISEVQPFRDQVAMLLTELPASSAG